MTNRLYNGESLADDEYLLKVYDGIGFLTKLTKKKELPKAFKEWKQYYGHKTIMPIYIHIEKPRSGWKLVKWRIGQSQEWATVMHPDGFTVEIYLSNFLELVLNNTIINGEIMGDFRWEDHKLKP